MADAKPVVKDQTDGELISDALNMRANIIETGDPVLSAVDAEASKKPFKALNLGQMKMVIRLRELAEMMRAS